MISLAKGDGSGRRPGFSAISAGRWLAYGLLALLFTLGSALGLAVHFRIPLLEMGLSGQLADLGLKEAEFSVPRVGLGGARLENIRLGLDLKAKSIVLTYSPSGLAGGRLARMVIDGLELDISQPDAGALGVLRQRPTGNGSGFALPPIALSRARLKASRPEGSLEVQFGGELMEDLSGVFRAVLEASAEPVAGHHLKFKQARISLDLGTGAKSAKFTLAGANLLDEAEGAPFVTPLAISGDGDVDGRKVTIRIGVRDKSRKLHLTVRGDLDGSRERAQMELFFPALAFARDGFQPADLVPLADPGVPVEGRLSGKGRLEWRAGALRVQAQFRAEALGVDLGEIALRDGWASLSLGLGQDRAVPRLRIEGGRVILARGADRFRLSRLEGFLSLGKQTPGRVGFNLRGARLTHQAAQPWFTPLTLGGEGSLTDEELRAQARVSAAGGKAKIRLQGEHKFTGGEGSLSARLARFGFVPGGPQPAGMLPFLTMLEEVSGGVAGRLDLKWGPEPVSGTASLDLNDLSFKIDRTSVAGLKGRLNLDGLFPPRLSALQKFQAGSITSLLTLKEPRLAFRLVPGPEGEEDALLIERAEGGLAGGRLIIDKAKIGGAAQDGRLDLRLERVDLAPLLALLNLEGVSATGRLSGTLPLRMKGSKVSVDGGGLAALGPGTLSFRSPKAKQALAAGGAQAALLLNVLEDFRYKRLSLKIKNGAEGQVVVQLGTEGHNPAVRDGHPFILNINLTGDLDRLAGTVMEVYRLSGQALQATLGAAR